MSKFNDLMLSYLENPSQGKRITINSNCELNIPNNLVFAAYGDTKKINWYEVYAGEKSFNKFKDKTDLSDEQKWLIPDTIKAFNYFKVRIKGPLTTPIGKGFRSLNVAIRKAIEQKQVTYDLARIMDNANELGYSDLGDKLISYMKVQ